MIPIVVISTCATCKHAEFEEGEVYARCGEIDQRPSYEDDREAIAYGTSCCCGGGLVVRKEFGCVLHEVRE